MLSGQLPVWVRKMLSEVEYLRFYNFEGQSWLKNSSWPIRTMNFIFSWSLTKLTTAWHQNCRQNHRRSPTNRRKKQRRVPVPFLSSLYWRKGYTLSRAHARPNALYIVASEFFREGLLTTRCAKMGFWLLAVHDFWLLAVQKWGFDYSLCRKLNSVNYFVVSK